MTLNVYFVRADSIDGDNLDLLVRASAKSDCADIWRKAYDLDSTDEPEWVGQVPGVIATDDTPGPIDWAQIN